MKETINKFFTILLFINKEKLLVKPWCIKCDLNNRKSLYEGVKNFFNKRFVTGGVRLWNLKK